MKAYTTRLVYAAVVANLMLLAACTPENTGSNTQDERVVAEAEAPVDPQVAGRRFGGTELAIPSNILVAEPQKNARRSAYFGDLHVHTDYSFDAYAFGTVATPYDAYQYAKGGAILHPAGFEVQLKQPLDFYAVTDHAMFLGAVKAAANTSTEFSKFDHVQDLHDLNIDSNQNIESLPQRVQAFSTFLPKTLSGIASGKINVEILNQLAKDAWADTIVAAQTHNQPGKFTTFVAYEYTSTTDERGNLHRNVIFEQADKLPIMPFSRFHSQNPEGLWRWMDGLRSQGVESLAIPHNSNGSNGAMFQMVNWAGDAIDNDYAERRARNEPLVEITQVKGTSETHPSLSDNDEWANFEIMPYRIATTLASEPTGSYARQALLNGLTLQDQGMANAYQFGFVGASDTHTGAASLDESNFFSKVGLLDATGSLRGSIPVSAGDAEIIRAAGRAQIKNIDNKQYVTGAYDTWGASGLTGVWAEENTRQAIYNALRRKETFATSGPRLKARLFGSFKFDETLVDEVDPIAFAYANGVSMGSELIGQNDGTPSFYAMASQDPNSAALQRLQIIKGWTVEGKHHEQVYDVACADGGIVNTETHRCPDNGATVDLTTCAISEDVGAGELSAIWQDPNYQADQRAFYYVRVLENPTCRWSTWDAVRAGVAPRSDLAKTIQERAWTSSIWLVPAS